MGSRLKGWMVLVVLLGTMAYAIAEEVTLTTYYPSPRGVYKELRVGSGTATSPTAKLQVTLPTGETGLAFRVDDQDNDPTPFVIDQDGNVGIGTKTPGSRLTVEESTASPTPNVLVRNTNAADYTRFYLSDDSGGTTRGGLMIGGSTAAAPWSNRLSVYYEGGSLTGTNIMSQNDVRIYTGGQAEPGNRRVTIESSGNVSIGTPTPQTPAPNSQPNNLDVNDVYLRGATPPRWVSQSTGRPTITT